MPLTPFPYGVSSFGFPLLGSGPYLGVGNVFFVSSVTGQDSNGRGLDPSRPFATINFALSKCSAPGAASTGTGYPKNGGDFIFVLPGHVENISVAGSSASPGPTGSISVNVSGVSVIGIGNGPQRPTIKWTATAGKIILGASNLRFENLIFDMATSIASVVQGISTSGTVTGFQFNYCDFITSTTAQAALIGINLATGWGDFSMTSCQVRSSSGLPFAAATSFLAVAAGDKLQLFNNFMNVDASNAVIDGGTAIITNVLMVFGQYSNVNSGHKPILKGNNSSTGIIREIHTFVAGGGGAVADVVSGTGWAWIQCFGKNVASGTAGGLLVPGTASY